MSTAPPSAPTVLPSVPTAVIAAAPARRRWLVPTIGVTIAAVVAGWLLWPTHTVSTDDAFIEAPVVPVAAQVAGTALEVVVNDNQVVAKGDLLVRIDPATWEARLHQAQAEARVATAEHAAAEADVTALTAAVEAAVAQANAEVAAAEAEGQRTAAEADAAAAEDHRAALELARQEALLPSSTTTLERVETARATATSANSAVAAAKARIAAAGAEVTAARSRLIAAKARSAEITAAQARVARAAATSEQAVAAASERQLDVDRTRITAPVAGRVTRRAAETGGWLQSGQTVLWLVPDAPWVVANFPETDLQHMHPGQKVDIRVDAYPAARFAGTVDSVQAGSGSRFSLLPAENATGNFVKIVQRVPVKITFDQAPDPQLYHLGPGMSVEPTVTVR